jgi:hypothetical protein
MKHFRLYATLLLSLVLFGCQVSRQALQAPVERTRTYNAPFDLVWTAMVKVLADDGYPFKIMEKASGVLQTDNRIMSEDDAYALSTTKKQAFGFQFRGGIINLKFFVESVDSVTTRVQITPYMEATFFVYKVVANVNEVHQLESNGVLEQSLFDRIRPEVPLRGKVVPIKK